VRGSPRVRGRVGSGRVGSGRGIVVAQEPEYTIAAVSKLTGISCHALRVWERRYGFPVPHRAPSGHRRYRSEHVRVLLQIAERVRQGDSIGELITSYRTGQSESPEDPPAVVDPLDIPSATAVVDLLVAGDLAGADAAFEKMAQRLSPPDLIARLIEPALIDTGERWFRGECAACQEHCASGFFRRKLDRLIDEARRDNPRPRHTAVVGTVQGDRHEGGVLIVTLLLERAGWRALPLGVDLPVREYQEAVTRWRPDALALSFVLSRNINKRFQELSQVRGVPVFVGGRSILNYQGLARRHGLIPLVGVAVQAIDSLLAEFDRWRQMHPADPGSS
jgi:methanogenic corrinoid protein MtbC1